MSVTCCFPLNGHMNALAGYLADSFSILLLLGSAPVHSLHALLCTVCLEGCISSSTGLKYNQR